jgi:hypothetical protein
MAYFSDKYGIIKEEDDLKWETPNFVKNFFQFITNIEEEKPYKSNTNLFK